MGRRHGGSDGAQAFVACVAQKGRPRVNGGEPGMMMNAGKERIQNAFSIEPTGERQRCERVVAVQPILIEALINEREACDIRRREQEIPVMGRGI